MKYIITENRLNGIVINWLTKNFGDLELIIENETPNHIFFKKNGKLIIHYNRYSGRASFDYNTIWLIMESMFNMEYQQIKDLTREWMRKQYNLDVTTTYFLNKNN